MVTTKEPQTEAVAKSRASRDKLASFDALLDTHRLLAPLVRRGFGLEVNQGVSQVRCEVDTEFLDEVAHVPDLEQKLVPWATTWDSAHVLRF